MKTLLLVLFCLIVNHGMAQTGHGTSAAIEVENVVRAWNEAFERNDPNAYFSYIHEDLTIFIPNSPYRIESKLLDREEFEFSLGHGWTRVSYFQELQMDVSVFGNTAVVTYHSRGVYGTGGAEKTIFLKETDVLVKENGQWKIIHIHVSGQ